MRDTAPHTPARKTLVMDDAGFVGDDVRPGLPRLIIPSLQVNRRARGMPPADKAGKTYLKVPLGAL